MFIRTVNSHQTFSICTKIADFQGLFLCSPPSSGEYLHHTVASGHGGPAPQSSPGGHLAEQLGQFALHLSCKHFAVELLLHYAQEDCVQQESKPSEQVSTHRSKHRGGEGDTTGCVHLCRGPTQDYHETLSTRQEA